MYNLKASSRYSTILPSPLNRPVSFKKTIILFVVPPKFCINIVFCFSWDLQSPQEKLKTILMRNLVGQKGYYGIEKKTPMK